MPRRDPCFRFRGEIKISEQQRAESQKEGQRKDGMEMCGAVEGRAEEDF